MNVFLILAIILMSSIFGYAVYEVVKILMKDTDKTLLFIFIGLIASGLLLGAAWYVEINKTRVVEGTNEVSEIGTYIDYYYELENITSLAKLHHIAKLNDTVTYQGSEEATVAVFHQIMLDHAGDEFIYYELSFPEWDMKFNSETQK